MVVEIPSNGANAGVNAIHPVSNDAEDMIGTQRPYSVTATLEGTSPFLFHRWSNEAVEEKARAAKGSKAKKTDDVESYVYRTPEGELAIPGEYFRQSIVGAARYRQDPRSTRKSAMDLVKAAVVAMTEYCSVGKVDWDYLDRRRVVVQRNAITRDRSALHAGWRCQVQFLVNLPEYVSPQLLYSMLSDAGRLVGVGDFRPTFGRFAIVNWEVDSE